MKSDIIKAEKSGRRQMKKNILFGLIILSFVLAGCKQDVKEEKEASTEVTKELSGGQEEVTETPEHTEIPGQNTSKFKEE